MRNLLLSIFLVAACSSESGDDDGECIPNAPDTFEFPCGMDAKVCAAPFECLEAAGNRCSKTCRSKSDCPKWKEGDSTLQPECTAGACQPIYCQ